MEQNREKYFNDVTRVTSLIDLKSREYQALVEKYEDMNKTNKYTKEELYSLLLLLRQNNQELVDLNKQLSSLVDYKSENIESNK